MSYFFSITGDIVAGKIETRTPGDNGDMATHRARLAPGPTQRRTAANKECRHVANVATPPTLKNVSWWRAYYDERAGIREHDGGLSRPEAEAGALADCVARWRALHALPAADDGVCAHCGGPGPDTPVLAVGGHAWLHRRCWPAMDAEGERVARTAVAALLGRR